MNECVRACVSDHGRLGGGGAFTLCSCCWCLIGHEGKISSVAGLAAAPARYPAAAAAAAAACIQRELNIGCRCFSCSCISLAPSMSLERLRERERKEESLVWRKAYCTVGEVKEIFQFLWHRHRTHHYMQVRLRHMHTVFACIGMETGRSTKGEACLALCGAVHARVARNRRAFLAK